MARRGCDAALGIRGAPKWRRGHDSSDDRRRTDGWREGELDVGGPNESGGDDLRLDEADDALADDDRCRRELRPRARTTSAWTCACVAVMIVRLLPSRSVVRRV